MNQIKAKTLRLYVVEEQEIYRELYKVIFPSRVTGALLGAPTFSIDLLGVSDNGDMYNLKQKVSLLNPDVILLSTKKLDKDVIAELEQVRMENHGVGLAILLILYDAEDIEMLRRLALGGDGGMALFLKQSLDQIVKAL